MRFNLTNLFFGLAIFVTFSACQDHRLAPPSVQQFRIKRTNYNLGSLVKTYTYNSLGKLSSYTVQQNTPNIETYTAQYDSQNRLTSFEGRYTGILVDKVVYSYNSVGDITKALIYYSPSNDGNLVLRQTEEISYNSDHLPVQLTETITGFAPNTINYTYANGNIVSEGGASVTFVYDTHPNPYYGLVNPSLTLFDVANKNNYIGSNEKVEYDSNGLLIKRSDLTFGDPLTYEYEAY